MTHPYRLHYAPDNASLIVRLVLEELGLPYQTTLVDRAARGQKAPGYLALNPNGLIPVLETPDGAMFETGAILLWLADRHGMLAPAPDDPARAGFLKWLFFVSNTVHPTLRMTFYPDQYVGDDPAAQAALRAQGKASLARYLGMLSGAEHMAPPAPTILTLYLACLLRWMALYPVDDHDWFHIGNWPPLHAMALRLEDCHSVAAAIHAEGLGQTPFTAPRHAAPPEGSAT